MNESKSSNNLGIIADVWLNAWNMVLKYLIHKLWEQVIFGGYYIIMCILFVAYYIFM